MASDLKSKQHEEELKEVDDEELMQVYDRLHILSDPFKPSPQTLDELVWVDEEVKNPEDNDFVPVDEEGTQVGEKAAMQKDIDESHKVVHTLSLKNHRFSIILKKSYFGPHYVAFLPTKTVKKLPRNRKVPAVLNSYGKIWNMFYNGHHKVKIFDCNGRKKFVVDNKLIIGDACFFEVLGNSPKKIAFEVVILRTDSSSSCAEVVDGTSSEKPIVLAN